MTTTAGDFDQQPPVQVTRYDTSIRDFCGAYEALFALAHCCLRAGLPDRARILIVGAGTGMELLTFAPANPGWSFCGVDPSADMLALARTKLAAAQLTNAIDLQQCRVADLAPATLFDAATCILVMHFLPDDGAKLGLLTDIRRRLQPDAPLILIDGVGEPGSAEFAALLAAWQHYPQLHGVPVATVATAFTEVILNMVRFVPESRIRELLHAAGFDRISRFATSFLYGGWYCRAATSTPQ
ncbi:MAG TPA: class I SAM-dependent methyltransferase [bacterium]|nr:class I SAM-dependent methyltransferase [bacterium]